MTPPLDREVFKICRRAEWEAACRDGVYTGSPDDHRDGFIHLSREAQVEQTLLRHFHGETDLLLVCLDAARLGDALRYEPSRGGELFPHLYGSFHTDEVLRTERVG